MQTISHWISTLLTKLECSMWRPDFHGNQLFWIHAKLCFLKSSSVTPKLDSYQARLLLHCVWEECDVWKISNVLFISWPSFWKMMQWSYFYQSINHLLKEVKMVSFVVKKKKLWTTYISWVALTVESYGSLGQPDKMHVLRGLHHNCHSTCSIEQWWWQYCPNSRYCQKSPATHPTPTHPKLSLNQHYHHPAYYTMTVSTNQGGMICCRLPTANWRSKTDHNALNHTGQRWHNGGARSLRNIPQNWVEFWNNPYDWSVVPIQQTADTLWLFEKGLDREKSGCGQRCKKKKDFILFRFIKCISGYLKRAALTNSYQEIDFVVFAKAMHMTDKCNEIEFVNWSKTNFLFYDLYFLKWVVMKFL